MKTPSLTVWLLAAAMSFATAIPSVRAQEEIPFTDTFDFADCRLGPKGKNNYFIELKPGCFLHYEGIDDGATVTLFIAVLPQTKVVDGVKCAVVREMEWEDGELVEISWNYFAICRDCGEVYYFGEDVDIYEDGEIVSHDGAWLAGVNGARAGLIMPGKPLNGSRYYQEIAPGVALDRAEHQNMTTTTVTPAGTFENCLFVVETSPLEPGSESLKLYARGIGLVQDGSVKLLRYGCDKKELDFELEEDEDEE